MLLIKIHLKLVNLRWFEIFTVTHLWMQVWRRYICKSQYQ